MSASNENGSRSGQRAGVFDVRQVIAALFVLYGLICTLMGLFGTSSQEIDQAAGININLWSGIGMLIFAGSFILWGWLRPIVVPTDSESESS
ncbi:hypothetical protein SAMN04487820_110190 [Actinopolyspora mzabensis]|uniref:Uncharacterized protein n=1 Tax=Actinopolyspora mzabensis TaxID=995066 RepID=A0A1G9DMN2_ACTMZ|nr:hypothetical protein [Actinopolyspora mzabensis]SDK65141.1 hypothetical protein SAMN04487820_110190 [Actinopolyspora mzabensis]